jgi:hypothetical protein
MNTPLLYRQLMDQLSQWVNAKDVRHLQGVSESVGAILQSQEACPALWLPYLSHRDCSARAHLERIHYLLENPQICAERFYYPLLQKVLSAFAGSSLTLAFDTSLLWNEYCLVEVSLIWGGRSLTVAQTVSGASQCQCRLRGLSIRFRAWPMGRFRQGVRSPCLADRGFDHKQLLQWLNAHQWEWVIRLKSDVSLRLASGRLCCVEDLWPPQNEAYLYRQVEVYDEIEAHLATAHLSTASEPWAVLSSSPPSLQTFELYGQRFGGIEPHFKDYKSAGFELARSRIRRCPTADLTGHAPRHRPLDCGHCGPSGGSSRTPSPTRLARGAGIEFSATGPARDCSAVLSATGLTDPHPTPATKSPESLCHEVLSAVPRVTD